MFKYFVLGSAFFIAACAAFFSVTGIGSLFVGAPISAMLMAASLELAKLVAVSFVYRYWEFINRTLRSYFLVAAMVLMFITSIGIYGYLSSAYAVASSGISSTKNQIQLVATQTASLQGQIDRLEGRSKALESIRTHQEGRLDNLVGKRGLRDQQKVVAQSEAQVTDAQAQITKLSNSRDSLSTVKVTLENSISQQGKVGTFYYIAEALGVSLDRVVMWFILAIVLVFDPLSVSLMLAYNIIKKAEQSKIIEESTEPTMQELLDMLPPDKDVEETPIITPTVEYVQPDQSVKPNIAQIVTDIEKEAENNMDGYHLQNGGQSIT